MPRTDCSKLAALHKQQDNAPSAPDFSCRPQICGLLHLQEQSFDRADDDGLGPLMLEQHSTPIATICRNGEVLSVIAHPSGD
jgi:hypothetical protein